jgi:hypothetical protein
LFLSQFTSGCKCSLRTSTHLGEFQLLTSVLHWGRLCGVHLTLILRKADLELLPD